MQCCLVSGTGQGLFTSDGKSDCKGKVETLCKNGSNKSTHGTSSTKVDNKKQLDSSNANVCTFFFFHTVISYFFQTVVLEV